jgi:hypothetical protein
MNAQDLSACLIPKFDVSKLKWFIFRQNNSGGRFHVDNNVDVNVIIQARNANEANEFALKIGIYFDGVADGYDCECCGDRWSRQWDTNEGTNTPEIYGKPIPWSPDTIMTSSGKPSYGLPNSIKVYPYNVILKK